MEDKSTNTTSPEWPKEEPFAPDDAPSAAPPPYPEVAPPPYPEQSPLSPPKEEPEEEPVSPVEAADDMASTSSSPPPGSSNALAVHRLQWSPDTNSAGAGTGTLILTRPDTTQGSGDPISTEPDTESAESGAGASAGSGSSSGKSPMDLSAQGSGKGRSKGKRMGKTPVKRPAAQSAAAPAPPPPGETLTGNIAPFVGMPAFATPLTMFFSFHSQSNQVHCLPGLGNANTAIRPCECTAHPDRLLQYQ